jgi:hypothetical protein
MADKDKADALRALWIQLLRCAVDIDRSRHPLSPLQGHMDPHNVVDECAEKRGVIELGY